MVKFSFQDLEIWQDSISIADDLVDIADILETNKLFKFAKQLRASSLSMSNNIAEGSGSTSNKEFSNFLNYARRSSFENANILLFLNNRNLVNKENLDSLLDNLDHLCRKITNFQKTLR